MEEKELTEFEWEMQALQQLMDPENYVPCISSAELMDQEFTPAEFVVKGFLPKGLCVLGGTPKIGKSWMMLDLCLHVAKGEPFLGMEDASSVTATVIHIMALLAMAQEEKTCLLGQLYRPLSKLGRHKLYLF